MADKTYTGDEVKKMLGTSMNKFSGDMISLLRECAVHPKYRSMSAHDALIFVANKLQEKQEAANG